MGGLVYRTWPTDQIQKYLAHVKARQSLPWCVRQSLKRSGTIYALLQSNGWREPEIKNLKLLGPVVPTATIPTMRRLSRERDLKKRWWNRGVFQIRSIEA